MQTRHFETRAIFLGMTLLALGALPGARAAEPAEPAAAAAGAPDAAAVAPDLPVARPVANPLHAAVERLLVREQEQLAALQARLAAAADAETALAVARQAEAVKLSTQRNVLELQLEWARQLEQTAAVQNLEAALARLPRPAQDLAADVPADAAPPTREGG